MNKEELYRHIVDILHRSFDIDASRIRPEARLGEDLDIDSIDAVELIVQLKPLLGGNIKPEAFKSVRTVSDVVDTVHAMIPTATDSPAGA
jgi:acyl carrier protein